VKAGRINRTEQLILFVITCLILVGSGFRLWYHQDQLLLEVEPVLWAGEANSQEEFPSTVLHGDGVTETTGEEGLTYVGDVSPETGMAEFPDQQGEKSGIQTHLININTASTQELMSLPGIGPVLAGRIVEYRKEQGAFIDVEQLLEVKGIGARILARLRPLVTVTNIQTTEQQ
jgi:comEA protein